MVYENYDAERRSKRADNGRGWKKRRESCPSILFSAAILPRMKTRHEGRVIPLDIFVIFSALCETKQHFA